MLENFDINSLEDPTKDKKYISIKNYLENCFLVIIESLNDNNLENYKLNKKIKKLESQEFEAKAKIKGKIQDEKQKPKSSISNPHSYSNSFSDIEEANSLKILSEKLEKNLSYKDKLIKFTINFLSNTQYKGIVDSRKFINNQKRQIKEYEGEINQLNNDIEKINIENQNKNHILDSILGQLENLKNNKIKENKNSYAYLHKKSFQIRHSNPIPYQHYSKNYKNKSKSINFDINNSYENPKSKLSYYTKKHKSENIPSKTISLDFRYSLNKTSFKKSNELTDKENFNLRNTITPIKTRYINYNSEDSSSNVHINKLRLNLTEERIRNKDHLNLPNTNTKNKNKILIVENLQSSNNTNSNYKQKKEDSLFLLDQQDSKSHNDNTYNFKEKKTLANNNSNINQLNNHQHQQHSSKEKKDTLKRRKEFLQRKKQINSILHYSNNRIEKFSGNSEGRISEGTFRKNINPESENLNINNYTRKFINDSYLNKENNLAERDFIFNKINNDNINSLKKEKEKVKSISQSCLTINSHKNIPVVTAVLDDSFPIEENSTNALGYKYLNSNKSEELMTKNSKGKKEIYSVQKIFAEKPKNVIIDLEQRNSNINLNENINLNNIISNKSQSEKKDYNFLNKSKNFSTKKVTLDLNYLARSLKLESQKRTKNWSTKNGTSSSNKIKFGSSVEIKRKIKAQSDKEIKNNLHMNINTKKSKGKKAKNFIDTKSNDNRNNYSVNSKQLSKKANYQNNKKEYELNSLTNTISNFNKQRKKENKNILNNRINNMINSNTHTTPLTPLRNSNKNKNQIFIKPSSNSNNEYKYYKSLQDKDISKEKKFNSEKITSNNEEYDILNTPRLNKIYNSRYSIFDEDNNYNENPNAEANGNGNENPNQISPNFKVANFSRGNSDKLQENQSNHMNDFLNNLLSNKNNFLKKFSEEELNSNTISLTNNTNNEKIGKRNTTKSINSDIQNAKLENLRKSNIKKDSNISPIHLKNIEKDKDKDKDNEMNFRLNLNKDLKNENLGSDNDVEKYYDDNIEYENYDNDNEDNSKSELMKEINNQFNDYLDLKKSLNLISKKLNKNEKEEEKDKDKEKSKEKIKDNLKDIKERSKDKIKNLKDKEYIIEKKISCIEMNSNSQNSIKILTKNNDESERNSLMVSSVANLNDANFNNSEIDILQNILGLKGSLSSNANSKNKFDIFNDDSNISMFNNKDKDKLEINKIRSEFASSEREIIKHFDRKFSNKDNNFNINFNNPLTERNKEKLRRDSNEIFKDALNKMKIMTKDNIKEKERKFKK